MRISFLLPGRNRSGGVRVAVVMGNRLRDRGHHVRLLCRRLRGPSAMGRSIHRTALRTVRAVHDDWVGEFRGPVEGYADATRISFTPGEIVVATGAYVAPDLFEIDADVVKVKWCHGFSDHLPNLMRRVWTDPTPTIAVSERLVERLERTGSPVAGVVPNGIDPGEYRPEPLPKDGVGMVYSRNPKKAPATALAAMEVLAKELPEARRRIFGAPRRPASLAPHEYVRYPSVTRARRWYGRSRVWIVPSRSEGFCLPILEAMACGAAVVSTDHDTARGLIRPGENGVLVPVDDAEALVREARRLWRDEKRRTKLVEAGFETVRRYPWDRAAGRMEDCLASLAKRRRATPSRRTRTRSVLGGRTS